jgi:hypothetical protein
MAESGIRAQNLLQYKKLGARMAHQTSGNKQLQTVPPLFGRLMDVSVLCPKIRAKGAAVLAARWSYSSKMAK